MTAPFVSQLRAMRSPVELTKPGPGALTLRVEASDIWETVRVIARPETSIAELKQRVVERLFPGQPGDEFVLKFRGWEVLDENASAADAGLSDCSILLIAYRRRRPVR